MRDILRGAPFTWASILLSALLLIGCQLLPATPEEAIGRTYITITSVADETAKAYQSGTISRDTAEEIWEAVKLALTLTTQAQQALLAGEDYTDPLHRTRAILQSIHDILEAAQ